MRKFQNQDEQTHFVAMGSNGNPILVKDEAIAKELFEIHNQLKNITNELNDSDVIMDDEWRELHEAHREQLWKRKQEILESIK